MTFRLSNRSINRLEGVHHDLVMVVQRAIEITPLDFGISEGLRNSERQQALFDSGASTTLKSRHLTGHAIDLVCYFEGEVSWHIGHYQRLHEEAMDVAANELDINIVWGADWDDDGDYTDQKFIDGCHWELSRKEYPA